MRILVIGPSASPLGEGGELDASCAEALVLLRERGHEVVFVTSNAATVSSDPALATRTYLEPLDLAALQAIVRAEKPTALLPLFGGQGALALTLALAESGELAQTGTQVLGISTAAIQDVLARSAASHESRGALAECSLVEIVLVMDETSVFVPVCTLESLDSADVHPGNAVAICPPLHLSPAHIAEIHECARAATVSAGIRSGVVTCEVVLQRATGEVHARNVTPGSSRTAANAARALGTQSFSVARAVVELALGGTVASLAIESTASRHIACIWPHFPFELGERGALRTSLGVSLATGTTLSEALRTAAHERADVPFEGVHCRTTTPPSNRVIVLGSGPSHIGQGPEFAVCASEAMVALRELGYAPEFVDISVESTAIATRAADHVHLEPVTLARINALCKRSIAAGVIVQLGGKLALSLAASLERCGITVFGTTPANMLRTELAGKVLSDQQRQALSEAISVDVDAVADGSRVVIAGVTEHLEPPFVHPGDAASMFPAFTLRPDVVARIEDVVRSLALDLKIIGLLSVHVVVLGQDVFVVDAQPGAGRTTAFITRATGFPLVRTATKIMLGKTLDDLNVTERPLPRHVAARERVFPFARLGVDTALGHQMRSTSEVIGLDDAPGRAYAKALRAVGISLRAPVEGEARRGVLFCLSPRDTPASIDLGRRLRALGFDLYALGPVRDSLTAARLPFRDLGESDVEGVTTKLHAPTIAIAIVTAHGDVEVAETRDLRAATTAANVPCFTTIRLAALGCAALEEDPTPRVRALQDWYAADSS